jgi:hypothetical protein
MNNNFYLDFAARELYSKRMGAKRRKLKNMRFFFCQAK